MFKAKINEETGEDMDDNVYFDECEVDDDDIDEVGLLTRYDTTGYNNA